MAALRVLEHISLGVHLTHDELRILGEAAADMAAYGHDAEGSLSGPTGFQLVADHLREPAEPNRPNPWGWKEPNSHLVLPELIATFPGLRYVHVVRHPLDMAFSSNKNQLMTWGHLFDIPLPESGKGLPDAQLRWWLRSTRWAVDRGRPLGDRFWITRFEDMCADRRGWTERLMGFIGVEPDEQLIPRASEHISTPDSLGRWRYQNLSGLDRRVLDAIVDLGLYTIPD